MFQGNRTASAKALGQECLFKDLKGAEGTELQGGRGGRARLAAGVKAGQDPVCVLPGSPSTGLAVPSPPGRVGGPKELSGLARALSTNRPNLPNIPARKPETQRERWFAPGCRLPLHSRPAFKPQPLPPGATAPKEDWRGCTETRELEASCFIERNCKAGPQKGSVVLSWARSRISRPASALRWPGQGQGGGGRGEGSVLGAQPAKSNLIEPETGLEPDKASAQHLKPLFPLFLWRTFPGTCSWASGAPGPGRGSHGIWFSRHREWPTRDPAGGLGAQ